MQTEANIDSLASPTEMTDLPQAPKGKVLLYLPWKFDMLGGVDVVVDRLWNGLEKRFPGMATIGIQDWEFHGDLTDDQGRRFLHLNLPAPPSTDGKLPLRYLVTLARRLPILLRELQKKEIATVNVHFPSLNAYPLALLKRLGLWKGRIVLSFHGSDVGDIIPNSRAWKTIAEQADAITACSAALAGRIDELSLFRQPAKVVHNGIDCERFLKDADTTVLPDGPYLLNVGNYVPRKAQDVLLHAFAQVALKHPELKVICVGGTDNGAWLNHLKDLTKQLDLCSRVVFLENQPQSRVASLMLNTISLVHTAHNEPFGLILIEAGACGTSIIATRVGGIPEIISSPAVGLLINDGDVDGLTIAIESVMQAPHDAKTRGESLKIRVANTFSAFSMVNNYLSIINGNSS